MLSLRADRAEIAHSLMGPTCDCRKRSTDLWISSTRSIMASDGRDPNDILFAADVSDRDLPMSGLGSIPTLQREPLP